MDNLKEIDAETFSELFRDQQELERNIEGLAAKENTISCSSYFNLASPSYTHSKEYNLDGGTQIKETQNKVSSPKKNSSGSFAEMGKWIKANPIKAAIAGTALIGAAIVLFKRIHKETSLGYIQKRKSKRRKGTTRFELKTSQNISEMETYNSEKVNKKLDKASSLGTKEIGTATASAFAGAIAGTALGEHSLIAAIPVAVAGIKKKSLNISMASIGMALSGRIPQEIEVGNFIEVAVQRVKRFFRGLLNVFFLNIKETPPGYIKTMLGNIPLRQVVWLNQNKL